MKNRILGIILVVFLGVLAGLMFNSIQHTEFLTRQLVTQQGEAVDLLRALVKNEDTLQTSVADISQKVTNVDTIMKRITPPPQRDQAPQEDLNKVHVIPLDGSVIKGDAKAPVTIVGFLDLQCPFSKRFQPVINQVLEAYPGQVKYVVKHFPLGFHDQAIPSAKAVLAAGEQGKFFEMMALVLENNNQLSEEKYQEFAKSLKLNVKKFNKDLSANDEAWTKLIQADLMLGQVVDVRGTPTFYLDGKKTNARSFEDFKISIDEILKSEKK